MQAADIRKILARKNKKLEGSYPKGKMSENDEGATSMAIGIKNGKVFIQFSKPIVWIGLDESDARGLAESLIKHADKVAKL